MSILRQDMQRLNNLAKMYHKTSGDMKEMWRKKWYELVKIIGGKLNEIERSTRDTRKIH